MYNNLNIIVWPIAWCKFALWDGYYTKMKKYEQTLMNDFPFGADVLITLDFHCLERHFTQTTTKSTQFFNISVIFLCLMLAWIESLQIVLYFT